MTINKELFQFIRILKHYKTIFCWTMYQPILFRSKMDQFFPINLRNSGFFLKNVMSSKKLIFFALFCVRGQTGSGWWTRKKIALGSWQDGFALLSAALWMDANYSSLMRFHQRFDPTISLIGWKRHCGFNKPLFDSLLLTKFNIAAIIYQCRSKVVKSSQKTLNYPDPLYNLLLLLFYFIYEWLVWFRR